MARISEQTLRRFSQSGIFDPDWYLRTYPDVAASGLTAAEHFLWLGARLGRKPHGLKSQEEEAALSNRRDSQRHYDAYFVDGTNGTASTAYRVNLVAEALAGSGWQVGTCRLDQAAAIFSEPDFGCRFLIIHRAHDYQAFRQAILDLRSRGTVIVYDVDDLIFDLDILPHVDAYEHMSAGQKRSFEKSFKDVREFALNADFCTTSTDFLVDQLQKLGKPAYRIRNSISQDAINSYSRVTIRRELPLSPFAVGYYSGTKTHQADFSVVAPALITFMKNNDDVIFRLVGKLDFSAYPELARWQRPFGSGEQPRVITGSLMPHKAMLRDQLTCDVIIAPLEVGNPFCEAKSELKFFEASLARCPVIAAATQTFVKATDEGRLALLAQSTGDWLDALEAIYQDYGRALERADAAFNWVSEHYSQGVAATEAMCAYDDFAARGRQSIGSSTLPFGKPIER